MARRTKTDSTAGLRPGTKVAWDAAQGEVRGTVERVVRRPISIKGHRAAASPAQPEVLVKSDRTGAEAVHRPAELRKRTKGSGPAPKQTS